MVTLETLFLSFLENFQVILNIWLLQNNVHKLITDNWQLFFFNFL